MYKMPEHYKLKVTDDLSKYDISPIWIPVTHEKAKSLMEDGKDVYSLWYYPEYVLPFRSVKIHDLAEEEQTYIFARRLVTRAIVNEWFNLQKEADENINRIKEIEQDFLTDVETIGHNTSMTADCGVLYSYDACEAICKDEATLTLLAGSVSDRKLIISLVIAINNDLLSKYNSITEMFQDKYDETYTEAYIARNVVAQLTDSDQENIALLRSLLWTTEEEALSCIREIQKIRNTVQLRNIYTESNVGYSFSKFKKALTDCFDFKRIIKIAGTSA